MGNKRVKIPEAPRRRKTRADRATEGPTNHEVAESIMTMCREQPKTTVNLMDELGIVMAGVAAHANNICNFLSPETVEAPLVEALPKSPNARLAFLIEKLRDIDRAVLLSASILGVS